MSYGAVDPALADALDRSPLARLTHFTPSLNIPGILENGELRSVRDLGADARACYRATDLLRLDRHPDKLCCSMQYPNAFYLDIARRRTEWVNYPGWVCLLLDKQIASMIGTLFCPRNAAAGAAHAGVAGFESCYAPTVHGQGGFARQRCNSHDPGSPTDVQAEVLVVAPVPLAAIRAMVFPSEAAAAEEYGRLERFGSLPPDRLQWVISPRMFEKQAVANAVRFGHYFAETPWFPDAER